MSMFSSRNYYINIGILITPVGWCDVREGRGARGDCLLSWSRCVDVVKECRERCQGMFGKKRAWKTL